MDYFTFRKRAKTFPIFKTADVFKWFPHESRGSILNQLHLWYQRGHVERIRRGLYKLADYEVQDVFSLAGLLYAPSYISLESALNAHGVIPDVPFRVTCVSMLKTKTFHTKNYGVFSYQSIKPELFFGFETVGVDKNYSYNIASPEKAMFDYLYLRTGRTNNAKDYLSQMRLSLPDDFDFKKIAEWADIVSPRRRTFHKFIRAFIKKDA